MMKVLLGRVLPIGAAAALLASSASPLQPALAAFTHAANALGGAQSEDTSDLQMPDEASVNAAIAGGGGFSLKKMFSSLFGPSESDKAKAQLDQIIANVKGRSAGGQPGLTPDGLPAGGKPTGTKSVAGKVGGGKGIAGGKGGAAAGKTGAGAKALPAGAKGAQPKGPAAIPTPGAEPGTPAEPATGGEGQAAAAGSGEGGPE